MGEFTGDYYKCKYCGHIWDFMDVCPNCGEWKMNTLNPNEVKEEAKRLIDMLDAHGDNSPNEATKALPLHSVVFSEERAEVCDTKEDDHGTCSWCGRDHGGDCCVI